MTDFWAISLFWIFVLLFIAIALAFILPPLLRRNGKAEQAGRAAMNIAIYRDQLQELEADLKSGELTQDQFESAKLEIDQRLSEDVPVASDRALSPNSGRWAGFALAGALPVLALALYVVFGNPDALSLPRAEAAPPGAAAQAEQEGQHDPSAMIAALEAKLQQKPDDSAGWYMLGRTYGAIGRFDEATRAFAKAAGLLPNDPRILADYAEALALTQGKKIAGKPLELINKALELNEKEEKALELAGIAAYQSKNFAQAAFYWRQLLKVIPRDTDYFRDIAAAAEEAEKTAAEHSGLGDKAKLGAKGAVAEKGQQSAKPAMQGGTGISGTVTIKGELIARVKSTDVVFIFAQAPGSKMPLASLKIDPNKLPYSYTLDDSMALTPNDKLSNHPEIVVSARISKSGQAAAQSGDLQGKSGTVKLGQQGVSVIIDTVLP
ncbi:MAG: c-type cytochrome biogenesis protein CcmI [Sulfuricellaceae bacterium]|nr:c-type cytochrome biogenesis protein CcmI [Sulfuricellaceae bacterium]